MQRPAPMKIQALRKHRNSEIIDRESHQSQIHSVKKDGFVKEKCKNSALKYLTSKGGQSVMRFAQELNINDIRQKTKSQNDTMFNLSDGTALLVALNRRNYDLNDDYVSKAPIRMARLQELQKKYPTKKVYFHESLGLAEAGDGFYATVPVFRSGLGAVGLGFGFSAGVILRYRSSQALVGSTKSQRICLPLSLEEARKMTAASEFELCGQGRIKGDVAIVGRYGPSAALAVTGVQASLSAVAQLAAEYSLNILSLDGHNHVRVTLRRLDQESLATSANFLVGLIFPANAIWHGNLGAPQVGHGLLRYFVEHKGNAAVETYINDYTTLSLSTSLSFAHKGIHICSFDLDLSNARAQEAYLDLMALDMNKALELANSHDGVTKIELRENQYSRKAAVRLALCSEKLFLTEALKSKSHGELIDDQGFRQVYRDRIYKRHRENWLTGQRDMLWEAVQIKKEQENPRTYYHFNYQKNDLFTRQHKIDDFFKFAESLGIKHACNSADKIIAMHSYKKLFSSADDTKLTIDLYFSMAGIEKIRESCEEQIIQAFLKITSQNYARVLGHPFMSKNNLKYGEILKSYEFVKSNFNIKNRKIIWKLKDIYFASINRDLKYDYKIYKKARNFARRLRKLVDKDQNHTRVGKLFTSIGRSSIGHYATVIPTLTVLAGRNNVLVHTLSVNGANVMLKSIDEGAFTHPRNEFLKSCMSVKITSDGMQDGQVLPR